MHFRRLIPLLLFVWMSSHLSAGVSLVGQVGRLFGADALAPVPLGSVALLVADTDRAVHPGLVNPVGTKLTVGSYLGGASGDLIVGVYTASDLGGGVVGVDLGGTTFSYSGAFAAGTQLWLVWFPTLTANDRRIGGAIPYGAYRSSTVDSASGSDIAFVAPPDGTTSSLYAYTSSLGFGQASDAELSASLTTLYDYSGAYFGTLGTAGGHWALDVKTDGTGTYLAYLPDRHSAIVVHLTIDSLGHFTVNGSEIVPLAAGDLRGALAVGGADSLRARAVATSFTLIGQITGSTVTGQLTGLGLTFTGAADAGGSSAAAGCYTATAIGAASGTTYAIVGPSGQTVVVTTSATSIDGASGTVNNSGQLSATTVGGAALSLAVSAQNQTVAATVTPAGSSTPTTFAGLSDTTVNTSRAVNIATRAYGSTGNSVTIGGFVISGTAAKRLLIRAVGPTLTSQGIGQSEVMLDPTIEVHDALHANVVIATNDNWADNTNAAEIASTTSLVGAAALLGSDSKSAALLVSLAPGVYSFVVNGKAGTSGIVLLEVYDADSASGGSTFTNIATRAYASTGNSVAIGGFVVSGNAPKRILMRAVGSTLTTLGLALPEILADPVIELHDASHANAIVATNDNWGDNANATDITATGARIGATPLAGTDTKSSALLLTLQPGVYSFIASGKSGTSGIVLVEVYDAD